MSLKPDAEETKFDYRRLLADHDEIEDMTCSICMELMDVGQTIVKTNCQQQVVAQSDMNSIFPNDAADKEVAPQPRNDTSLKGHKFHIDCFKCWLARADGNISSIENARFNRCPLCRAELMHRGSARNLQSSTVRASGVGPASSAVNQRNLGDRPRSDAAGRIDIQSRSRSN